MGIILAVMLFPIGLLCLLYVSHLAHMRVVHVNTMSVLVLT